jgi:5,10-methylenetetrahydromethanopterin reductase
MNGYELAISFQTDKPLQAYAGLAQKAEEYGFDVINVYNDLLYQPAWLPLMEIARHTSRARIGVSAMNPFTCHPINIAGNIALINDAAGGRAYLGLTRGAWLDRIGVYPERGITAMREALACIRHLLDQNTEPLDGEIFPVKGSHHLRWRIEQNDIPFLLGSWGLETIRKCAGYVQEIKLGGSANPDLVPWYREHLDGIESESEVGIVMGAVTVVDEDGSAARALAKLEVAQYLSVVANNDKTLEVDPEALERIESAVYRYDFEQAARDISDELLARFAFAGTPGDIIAHTEALIDAGAARIEYGTPHGISEDNGLKLLGEKVVPAFADREKMA